MRIAKERTTLPENLTTEEDEDEEEQEEDCIKCSIEECPTAHARGQTDDGRTDEERGRNSGRAAGVVTGQGGPGPGVDFSHPLLCL